MSTGEGTTLGGSLPYPDYKPGLPQLWHEGWNANFHAKWFRRFDPILRETLRLLDPCGKSRILALREAWLWTPHQRVPPPRQTPGPEILLEGGVERAQAKGHVFPFRTAPAGTAHSGAKACLRPHTMRGARPELPTPGTTLCFPSRG